MSETKYWQGLEELRNDPEFEKNKYNEFAEELPILDVLNDAVGNQPTKRRDFLKYMGFSVSAAVLAASCEVPVRKAIPYVFKPEEVIPGVANYYASTFADGSDYVSVLVKTREGRPIKIEGNTLSNITQGGTNARAQASILSLYDNNRITGPIKNTNAVTWEEIDRDIAVGLKAVSASGKSVVILSSTIISPSTKKLIEEFLAKYPGSRHIMYDAISYSGILDANQQSFGQRVLPSYHFEKAKTIVSFGADFLGTWISPVEYAKQYISNRKLLEDRNSMSKHYQFESNMSMTGSNADVRVPLKPSKLAHALINLHNEIAGQTGGTVISGADRSVAQNEVKAVAADLMKNRGSSLIVCGINDLNLQLVTNSINNMLGNYGTTINISVPSYYMQGNEREVLQLVRDMKGNGIGALLMYNCNPCYDLPNSEEFTAALKNVTYPIAFSVHHNETSKEAKYVTPDHHYLESWNDAEPRKGHYSLVQPTIRNIFNTRQFQDSLITWMDIVSEVNIKNGQTVAPDTTGAVSAAGFVADTTRKVNVDTAGGGLRAEQSFASSSELPKKREYESYFYNYIKENWRNSLSGRQTKYTNFNTFWDKTLHDGVFVADDAMNGSGAVSMSSISLGTEVLNPYKITDGFELYAYEKVGIGTGAHADNPWLQEMPDPVTKATWDNYVLVSVADAKALDLELGSQVNLTANGKSVNLPVVVQPGQSNGTLGVAVGYGRRVSGKAGLEVGKNIYPFLTYNENGIQTVVPNVEVTKLPGLYPIAQTQIHHVINSEAKLDQRTIIKEGILPELAEVKERIAKQREFFIELNDETLYPGHEEAYQRGHHWKMAIDLTSCIGCGACTVACHAENNVPVVGKEEVLRVHEMHWLRIDRYYTGENMENPDVVFQPMLCQHCDNAPCENVCPVAATTHSSEGINQMAYNRCIGTRYCANNCPYKVRRFNWFDYLGADSFPANEYDPFDMSSDLTRMVLNPDVVVRGRGVMEKCSFCIQRIQEGKITAKREGRKLQDGDVVTACMAACPTTAIVFGDGNDKDSLVNKLLNDGRTFYVIEEINTSPNVGYMAKIRNRNHDEEVERRDTPLTKHI